MTCAQRMQFADPNPLGSDMSKQVRLGTQPRCSAEVRKGCVFVYVELHKVMASFLQMVRLFNPSQVLGDGLQPHLKGVSASQVMLAAAKCGAWSL